MNNLQPEIRVDKNGKLVTRHVKTASSSPAAASRFAPPTVVNPKHAHIDRIMEPLLDGESNSTVSATLSFLHNCPDHIVERAAAAADSPTAQGVIAEVLLRRNQSYLALVVGSVSTWLPAAQDFAAHAGDKYGMNQFANGLFSIYRGISDTPASGDSMTDVEYEVDVRSFRMEFIGRALGFDQNARTHYDYYSRIAAIEPEHEAIAEILPTLKDITERMSVKDKYGNLVPRPLKPEEVLMIVDFAKDEPERFDAFVDFIKERRTVSQDIIREFKSASPSPLTRGLL